MADVAAEIRREGRLLMTGEGSSRLFPSKGAIAHARRRGWPLELHTEAGLQASEYDLSEWAVFALSNSGRTAEVIQLFMRLRDQGHRHLYSLTAHANTTLESLSSKGFVLSCGKEGAVAASKSVVEQALFYRALLEHACGLPALKDRLGELADAFHHALTAPIDAEIVEAIARADTIYWAGRNNGVGEELTLKTNEITRKKSDFLEGTYAVHGIEEIMSPSDVVLWIDPYEGSEEKFHEVLERGVGLKVIALASRATRFATLQIPDLGDLSEFVQIAAGWNILVAVGLALGVDLDRPQRARKVGNEFVGA
jgi:glucosamine--fructose-6-phosphate aminotransferase (isomerizing)